MNPARDSSTREWLVITVLTLVGAILRFWNFGRLSLTHFDEGIYAFSGLWVVSKHGLLDLDPGVIAYAPPGFPLLVGLSYGLFGVSDYAAIVVAIIAGIATIPVVGWLGRRTFGPGAGAAAATFAALAMAHVAFSRKALTDAPFLLAWLVAIGAGGRFLVRPGFVRALLLGVAVGVAQNFKYNGWLAGVIVGLAAVAAAVVDREARRRGALLRTFGWGLFAAFAAALLYAPWYVFVETHGGYAALIRHHRGYMNPPRWIAYGQTQLGEAFALSGPWYGGVLIGLTAWLAFAVASGERLVSGPVNLRRALGWSARLCPVVLGCSFPGYFPWWLGLGLAPWLLTSSRPASRLLGVWWTVMTVMIPLYHPYARLWLPLHALGWLLMAGVTGMLGPAAAVAPVDGGGTIADPFFRRKRHLLVGTAAACAVSAAIHVGLSRPSSLPWTWVLRPPEPSLRRLAQETIQRIIPRKGTTLSVYAARPLAFYLAQLGTYSIELLSTPTGIVYVGGPPNSWALVERDMLEQGGYTRLVFTTRKYHASCLYMIDPVTLLDTQPGAAFSPEPRNDGLIYVWSPLFPEPKLNPAADTAPPSKGPAHAP